MTEKIYNYDGMVRAFTACVTGCEKAEKGFAVTLNRTAFFPGGGGQTCDTGTLDGCAVTACYERDGEVYHIVNSAVEPGKQVQCALDWPVRFRKMQHHSGEHIVCGVAHRLYGCENVGFHMDEGCVVMDLDKPLTDEQLVQIEREANEAIWRDVPVRCRIPTREELETLPYRSKGEPEGEIRLVEFEGVDLCACCAPHVASSGMVGCIKILDAMKHRGGMRLTITSGADAFADHVQKSDSVLKISNLLSVKQENVADGVRALLEQLEKSRQETAKARKSLADEVIRMIVPTKGNAVLFAEGLEAEQLRAVVTAGMELCGGICFAFSGNDESGYKYCAGSKSVDMRSAAKAVNGLIGGRGGGSQQMIQGSCGGNRRDIEQKLNSFIG